MGLGGGRPEAFLTRSSWSDVIAVPGPIIVTVVIMIVIAIVVAPSPFRPKEFDRLPSTVVFVVLLRCPLRVVRRRQRQSVRHKCGEATNDVMPGSLL